MKKFFSEFKDFILRGNVLDMAVGVIIGAAFNAIITSLVQNILTPIISIFTTKTQFADLTLSIPNLLGSGVVEIKYGVFIESIISFLIMAFSVFIVIKVFNKLSNLRKKSAEEEPEDEEKPSNEEVLLTEIRDLLEAQNTSKE